MECVEGFPSWRGLPDHKLLITRAIRLLTAATIRPAHARPPHPTWVTAVRQILPMLSPSGQTVVSKSLFSAVCDCTCSGRELGKLTSSVSLRDRILDSQSMKCSMSLPASREPPRLRLSPLRLKCCVLHHRGTAGDTPSLFRGPTLRVWRPDSLTDLSYNIVLIEGHPAWSGRSRHAYGHLLFTTIAEGTYHIDHLQITTPQVIPHGVRCEGLLASAFMGEF